MIYCIGDSHARVNFTDVPNEEIDFNQEHIIVHNKSEDMVILHLGPQTMHRVGRDGFDISFLDIKENDILMFDMGEIDARTHIGYIRDRDKKTLDEVLEDLVSRYIKAIKDCQTKTGVKNPCIICCVVPPSSAYADKDRYGTFEDRKNVTESLNKKLKEHATKEDMIFFDFYNLLTNEKGEMKPEITSDKVHVSLNNNYIIKEAFHKELKKYELI